MLGEERSWGGRFDESDLSSLRCVLLYAGGKTRHRSDRKIRDRLWIGTEDWNRSAQRSEWRDAFGRMEDPQFQAEGVCRGDNFGSVRPGPDGPPSRAIEWRNRAQL